MNVRRRMEALLRAAPLWVQDLALALLLTAFTQWEISQADFMEGPEWVQRLTFVVMTGSVAGRRVAPLTATVVGFGGLVGHTVWAGAIPVVGGFIAGIIVTHSVALFSPKPRAIAGLIVILAAVHSYVLVYPEEVSLADELGNAATFIVIWALGRTVRSRQERTEVAEAHAARVEAERDLVTQAAIAEERGRIARELHDVVAHGVSVMVLQAGAARQVLGRDPDRVRDPLLTIEESGRQALDDMHRLLGILRRDADEAELTPLAGLAQVPELARQMREVGLDVVVTIEGCPRPLPASVDLSAYRIIQEALTNTLKHAGNTSATVTISHQPSQVALDVVDAGGGSTREWTGGHGLIGMQERASLFGGAVEAGPLSSGGWRVHAVLPTSPA